MTEYLDSIKIVAYPGGVYTDITSDVLSSAGISAFWGIRGSEPTNIIADTGDARMTLKNIDKLYYPDGSSALTGWTQNIPIKIICTYDEIEYVRFKGYLDIDSLRVGKVAEQNRVSVTLLDWLAFAIRTPITQPSVELAKTADEGITSVLAYCPIQPGSTDLETGDYTFPVIFDSVGIRTKAYSEFVKFAFSEAGYIYLTKDRLGGETLVFENASHRESSHALSTTIVYTYELFLNHVDDNFLNHSGGVFKKHSVSSGAETDVEITADIDDVQIDYGKNIINRAVVSAFPRRIDEDPQVLYSLDYPMAIADGQTITFRAGYRDQNGGRAISAVTSSMIDPVAPGATDTYMKLLLHFTTDFTDSTGNHTVTNNDVTVLEDAYLDVGPDPDIYRINGNILGPYAIFGGYSAYNLEVPSSSDFEFGSGAFTVGWYENLIEPTTGNTALARDISTYSPWMFAYPYNETNMLIYMSSNGSSWDIANAKSLGEIQRGRWTHYEVSRDAEGWFYAFADGKLTDKWYSALSFPANANALSIGKTQTSNYAFMGFDELYIKKGEILHKKDFEPPKANLSHLLEGDYWLNTAIDETGTDNSDNLVVSASYNSSYVRYTITNNSGSAGYFYVQARGLGIYPYNTIEDEAENAASYTAYGYNERSINQNYQQNLIAGTAWITDIIAAEKDPRTRLNSISFYANKNATTMARFLQCDVGYLIHVTVTDPEIDGYYYIQSVEFEIRDGGLIYVTWGLKDGQTPV